MRSSNLRRDPAGSQRLKGSFAPLGELHKRIESEFIYDSSTSRFTPKNPMGAAAETLDVLHSARTTPKSQASTRKCKVATPTISSMPPSSSERSSTSSRKGHFTQTDIADVQNARRVVEAATAGPDQGHCTASRHGAKEWDALLKRSFHTLKADGPFIFERAEVTASATDRLASSGDPPTRLRLSLVRFQLEGIDTGWKVVAVRRILPGADGKVTAPQPSTARLRPNRRHARRVNPRAHRMTHGATVTGALPARSRGTVAPNSSGLRVNGIAHPSETTEVEQG